MAHSDLWKRDWGRTLRRVWDEMLLDDCFGASAQLAYYFLLGFFPFLFFVLVLVGSMPITGLVERTVEYLMGLLAQVMPDEALQGIDEIIETIVVQTRTLLEERRIRLLSISLPALMVASNGMRAIMVTLNRAWSVREGRNLIQRYLLALALTVALAIIVIATTIVQSRADHVTSWISIHWGDHWATALWWGIQIVAVGGLVFLLELIYHMAPNVRRPWHWITPGSIFGVLLWLTGTKLFKMYVARFGQYDAMYASLGAVVVFLLWLYIAGLAILVGGEINAELERSSGLIPSPAVPAPEHVDAAGHDTKAHRGSVSTAGGARPS